MKLLKLGILLLLFYPTACSRVKTTVDYDSATDFSRYSSFAWSLSEEETRDIVLSINRDIWIGVRRGVGVALKERGFSETRKEDSDLLLHIDGGQADGGMSGRDASVAAKNKISGRYDFDPSLGDSDFAGYAPAEAYSSYSRDRLRLTVEDRKKGQIVWVGSVDGVVDDFSSTKQQVDLFVSNLMRKFPRKL